MKQEDAEEFTQSLGQIVGGSWRQIALAKRLGVPDALGLSTEDWVQQRLGGYIKLSIPDRREAVANLTAEGESTRAAAQILGVSHDTVARDVANLTDKRAAKEAEKEIRRAKNAELVALTPDPLVSGARFATIMLDPPWDWGDEGDVDQMGRAKPAYATMPFDQILQLPIPILADRDCHLYLWITNRSLPKGFTLIERWGFRYVTCVTWAKPHFGMGNYFRGQTEHVLFGVKGSQPLKRADVGTLFPAPRGPLGHSSKPPQFYDLVESCSPGPYLEMFARSGRAGWIPWGAEAHAA